MEHLMHELVGRSIARERERHLAQTIRTREAEAQRLSRRRRPAPRHRRPGPTPVVAHA